MLVEFAHMSLSRTVICLLQVFPPFFSCALDPVPTACNLFAVSNSVFQSDGNARTVVEHCDGFEKYQRNICSINRLYRAGGYLILPGLLFGRGTQILTGSLLTVYYGQHWTRMGCIFNFPLCSGRAMLVCWRAVCWLVEFWTFVEFV